MLTLLYGENNFLAGRKLQEIIRDAQKAHKNGLFIRRVDCASDNAQDVINALWQPELMAAPRLSVLKNVFKNIALKEHLAEKVPELLSRKEPFIFFEEGMPRAKDKLFLFLKKNGETYECKNFQNRDLESWARDELKACGAAIEPDALTYLLAVSSDPHFLENEIKKLAAFKKGRKIQLKDVSRLCHWQAEGAIFKALDALSTKNKRKASELLHRQIQKGDSPLYVLSMIGYQLRNMLAVKELAEQGKARTAIIKETGLHPYVAQKTINNVGQFSLGKLKKIYQGLLKVDVGVKTGKVLPETALDILVSRIN